MKRVQVYEPAMYCDTGGCSAKADKTLMAFAADVEWANKHEAQIERFTLSQQPEAFSGNPRVASFLDLSGADALPLILVDGQIALAGRYPNRAELARLAQMPKGIPILPPSGFKWKKPKVSCC